jgi:hemoglobin/transferrin/lactoferrin receptor protein
VLLQGLSDSDSLIFRYIGYQKQAYSWADIVKAGYTVYLKPDALTLESTVISASRFEEDSLQSAVKISTIRSRDVMLQNPQTAADLLNISGDVFIQKSQAGGGSPMIRGFATNRVLIAVDGVRMNNAIFRSGNVQNVISLDPFAISSTEVLFGPGSLMYGSDALGGVMHFHTLKPIYNTGQKKVVDKAHAALRYASANQEKTGHFDFNIGLRKWSFLSSATWSDYGDLKMGSHGPDAYLRPNYVQTLNGRDTLLSNPDPRVQRPSGYQQMNLMQKIYFKPGPNLEVRFASHYAQTSTYSRYDRLTRPRGNGLRSAEWNYGPQIWALNHITLMSRHKNVMYDKMQLNVAHQWFEESRIERDFNRPMRYSRFEALEAWSANMDFEKGIGERHSLQYGLEAVINQVASTGVDEDIRTGIRQPGPSRYPDGADWQSIAAYVQDRWKLNEKLTLQSGIRYNVVAMNAVFEPTFYAFPFEDVFIRRGALTGSAGLVYRPHATWIISSQFATGFRSPNIDDIGKIFDSNPGNVVVPNPQLLPEYTRNIDLSLAKVIAQRVKLDLTGFYSYLDRAIVRRDYVFNGADSIMYNGTMSRVQALQNGAFARIAGIQAGVDVQLPYGFSLLSRFNFMEGIEELDNGDRAPLRHAAPWFGLTRLGYHRNKFRAEFYVQYNGSVRNLPPEEVGKEYMYALNEAGEPWVPAWHTYNLKCMYQVHPVISVSAGIENIADLRYRPYSSGISAPGRNLILAVRGTF